jgi:hypothetical protein
VKPSIFAVLALASVIALAQEPPVAKTPTQQTALTKIAEGEKTVAQLNTDARTISKKIGELALRTDLSADPAALEEMKKLVAALDEINTRLETLEGSIADLKEWAAGKDKADAKVATAVAQIDKIKFSNYFQFQFRDTDQAGKTQHSFEARRVRLGATYEINDEASAKVSYDFAAGTNRSGGELKDFMLMYKPKGGNGLLFTAGQFPAPFGYETPTSSSALEFPERVAYNKALFNDERLRGLMIEQPLEGGFRIYGGVVNALSTKDAEQASLAPGAGARLAGFAGVKYKQGNAEYGLGYFAGKRPEYTSGGTSPEVDRRFLYADAQWTNIMDTGLWFRGEVMTGEDRVPSSTGAPGNFGMDMTGYTTVLGMAIDEKNDLFARYSQWDVNRDTDGDAVSEWGLGWRHHLGSNANVTLAHEIFRDNSVANSPYGVTTFRVQFKF